MPGRAHPPVRQPLSRLLPPTTPCSREQSPVSHPHLSAELARLETLCARALRDRPLATLRVDCMTLGQRPQPSNTDLACSLDGARVVGAGRWPEWSSHCPIDVIGLLSGRICAEIALRLRSSKHAPRPSRRCSSLLGEAPFGGVYPNAGSLGGEIPRTPHAGGRPRRAPRRRQEPRRNSRVPDETLRRDGRRDGWRFPDPMSCR